MSYLTDQEKFWAGQFGNDYIKRNMSPELLASNVNFFTGIFNRTENVNSILELGCNVGMNLRAMKTILPNAEFTALEINETAVNVLKEVPYIDVIHGSILEYQPDRKWDFVFTKGVLIHINPDHLDSVYELMYNSTNKYIVVAEYYNRTPVAIPYRGEVDRLFKRDFAGELLDKYPDLKLVDYGFSYHRDNNFKQDDVSWFLLEK